MPPVVVKDDVYWVGAVDWKIRDFHGYSTQKGSTYNAYLVMDERIALFDTVKNGFQSDLLHNIRLLTDPEKIDYIVVGGLAVNMHGIPRMTYDMDLMILLESENIQKIVSKLKEWGYLPRVSVQPEELVDKEKRKSWIQEKNMKAFSFYNEKQTVGEIDLIIDSPIPYEGLKNRANIFDIDQIKVPVISIQDLIELKIDAGRKQDLSDVEHLRLLLEE